MAFSVCLHGQEQGGFEAERDYGQNRNPNQQRDTSQYVEVIDTVPIQYFNAYNPLQFQEFKDTSITNFNYYDPALSKDYGHLGNLGSAHHSILFRNEEVKELRLGYKQFDAYMFRAEKHQFFKLESAFTDVAYTQGGAQEDAYFKAQFSRNFTDGIQLSLNYGKINHQGIYNHQKGVNTNLSIGLWYQSPNRKLNTFFTFASNVFTQEDNGGIQSDTSFGGEFTEIRTAIPVQTTTANTRFQDIEYSLVNQVNLFGENDSLLNKRTTFAEHKISFSNRFFKAIEDTPNSDSGTAYYGEFLTDDRGLRHFVKMNSMENGLFFKTFKIRDKQSVEHLFIGATLFTHKVDQEPLNYNRTDLFLEGEVYKKFNRLIDIKAKAHIGLLDRTGDFLLKGSLGFQTGKIGKLTANLRIQNYSPSILESSLFISQTEAWSNTFNKSFETYLKANYFLEKFQLNASFEQYLISNYIFYNQDRVPEQSDQDTRVSILSVSKNFKLWNFHLDNTLSFQSISGDNVRLPSFHTRHSAYYQGRIFRKVLLLQLGFTLRTFQSYQAPTYFPIIGSFHQQDVAVPFYPYVNAFANFKIGKSFRAFLIMENFNNLFSNDIYYTSYFYPMFDATLRFGFKWRLRG